MNKERRKITLSIIIFILVITLTIGASYAYFATTNKTTGNNQNLNIVTEDLGSIKWEGTKVFASGDLLPGECGIQTFTIEKNSASGKGIYEIDLKGILDESFGSDVEITLYKTTNTTTNNVTIKEGESTISGDTTKQYYKEDSVVLNGTPEKVYGTKVLQNKDQIILEQSDFDNSTLQKTKYYLVYCYKNADHSQDEQQGKSFSGEISVRLIQEKTKQLLTEYIKELSNNGVTNLVYDETKDNNLRYIGSDPDNYISIDGELWRIIGVMNNIDDGTGKKESRIKLIRNESIGAYSWDTSDSSVNSGYGVNEWSGADIMKLLNPGYESESVGGSLYWNNQSGTCYNELSNATTVCDFTNSGIKNTLKNLISDAMWNIGSNGTEKNYNSILTSNFYELERSVNIGKICSSGTQCNDNLERTTTWTGKVGLMYPSDYGYATGGDDTIDRTECLNSFLYAWYDAKSVCSSNDWLYNATHEWTLSPTAYSTFSYGIFHIQPDGYVTYSSARNSMTIRPSVYLKSSVKIVSGTGSSSDPFIIGA